MLPIFEHIHSRKLRPIIWADIVLAHPEIIQSIPKYVVLMDWNYWTESERTSTVYLWNGQDPESYTWDEYKGLQNTASKEIISSYAVDKQTEIDGTFKSFHYVNFLKSLGFNVMTASANKSHGDSIAIPKNTIHLPNIFYSSRKGLESGMGHLVTSWAVRHNHPEVGLPGAFTAAWAVNNEGVFDERKLAKGFTLDFFGIEMPEFSEAMRLAEPTVYLCESKMILAARKDFSKGFDPIHQYLVDIENKRSTSILHLEEHMSGFKRARDIVIRMRERAEKNNNNLNFWLEGIDLASFYTDFHLAVLKGELADKAQVLMDRLLCLQEKSRKIFAQTYAPISVEEEIDIRYCFHETYLKALL